MSERVKHVLQQLIALTPDEQSEVLSHFDGDEPFDFDRYWQENPDRLAELHRRLDTIADGTAVTYSLEETRDYLRVELDRRRKARAGESS